MTQIFIQVLADYNAGRLVGEWVNLAGLDKQGLQEAIEQILQHSKEPFAEEVEIADYDGFYGLTPGLSKVLDVARLIEKYGEAYALYALHVGETYASEEGFEEAYQGQWDSFEAYAIELFDDIYRHDVPDYLEQYIDYDAFAHNLLVSDYYAEKGAGWKVHVFREI